MASLKGVLLGQWRDSTVPDAENRHAVIGFIDSRDRLRTRIQRSNVKGDPSGVEYPLPPGPGGSWVTLDRIIFFPHLVGLNHIQIKEYVKLRADAAERSDEERQAAEAAAVKEAIHRAKADPSADSITNPLSIAHGEDLPETLTSTGRSASKRRRVNGGAAAMAEANVHLDSAESSTRPATSPPSHARLLPGMSMHGALHGSRPTRILLGYWKGSSEPIPEDRHAVHGILGHNDMFRVKITKSTRDGRFVDGNFPSGAGALWIQYEEVEFEPHLKPLSRSEVKEYCRIRQYQIDHGETPPDRIANETKAVYEAQARVASGAHKFDKYAAQRAISHSPPLASETEATNAVENANEDDSNMNLRQTRRNEKRKRRFSQTQQRSLANVADTAKPRGAKDDNRVQSSESRSSSRTHAESLEKANALARKEIARVEAAQGRIDRHAYQRERAAVMAADAAAAAAVTAAAAAATSSPSPPVFMANGRASSLHESEGMQRLNKVWAAQESIRMKAGSEDAKIYDGIKYERKANGPFVGKLVSQGTIINIDGEDYVEYRVLTKPSFF
ncbi:hypothetical protein ESCO_001718 [Escovopsis weberi]|uniref:Uncharacterized protein n=1 Tax=Escovopsis weberi TaxID=150374 RepID=A0A0M9VWH6_ESCWE|nr:hypothetical protein ESCO_001718 [Escovopsis weberi]